MTRGRRHALLHAVLTTILVIVCLLLCVCHTVYGKGIHVTVEASWNETPFYQEGCEWAGRNYGDAAFYGCLQGLWDRAAAAQAVATSSSSVEQNPNATTAAKAEQASARYVSQQAQYTAVKEVALALPETQSASLAFFELEMASRVYSPAVEAHYNLAMQAVAAAGPDAETACTCGGPFAVLYTRRSSAAASPAASDVEGPVAAQLICSAAALEDAKHRLQAQHEEEKEEERKAAGGSPFVSSLLSIAEVAFPRLDHRYPTEASTADSVAAVVVLYGLPGSAAAQALHTAAVAWTSDPTATTLAYFFRHLPPSRLRLCHEVDAVKASLYHSVWDTPLMVQGYGATVDIKNMEYKVLDEKAAAHQQTQEGGAEETADATTAHVVGGFHMQRLKERYPPLAPALNEFEMWMDDEVGTGDMKVDFDVWELQSIGLAAAQYVREVDNASRRFDVLKEVVTRFPLYAATLSRVAAQPDRYATVKQSSELLNQRLPPGLSALFVNGWHVEEKDLSLFGVLDALRLEEHVSRQARIVLTTHALTAVAVEDESIEEDGKDGDAEWRHISTVKVDPAVLERINSYVTKNARRAVHTFLASPASEAAFALPSAHVTWLNDVETDELFENQPTKLTAFFSQAPGVVPFPRRNVLNYVFVWTPTLRSHLQLLSVLFSLRHQGLMARYGALMYDPEWSPDLGGASPDVDQVRPPGFASTAAASSSTTTYSAEVLAIAALAYHLAAAGQQEVLLNLLVQLLQIPAQSMAEADALPPRAIHDVCSRIAESALGRTLADLTRDPEFVAHYHETQVSIRRFPMQQYPAVLLNGVPHDVTGGSGLTMSLRSEVLRLREWVADKRLTDDMPDLYEAILNLRGAADHLQPALLDTPHTMSWSLTPPTVALIEGASYAYSAAYADDVPSLTQVLAVPCHVTPSTVRQLQTVLSALQSCGGNTEKGNAHYDVCRSLRVTVLACPSAAAPNAATGASIPLYLEALLRQMRQQDVAEKTRYHVLQRYLSHVADALTKSAAADHGSSGEAVVLTHERVAAALQAYPLPADLQIGKGITKADDFTFQHGRRDFWAAWATAGGAATLRSVHDVSLVTNGRLIAMDGTFTEADVLEAAQLVLPMTKVVEEAVLQVSFEEMTGSSEEGRTPDQRFAAEELNNAFYGGKISCLTSLFADEMEKHAAAKTSMLVREEAVLASAADVKQFRPLLFTVNNSAHASEREVRQYHITAIVDPSSREAQGIVSLAHTLLQSQLRVRLTVLLNPNADVKFPIRDFYEFVARGTVVFDESAGTVVAPAATFAQLPSTALLTLGVEEPPTWTVFSQEAEEDLDNIMLSKLPRGTPYVSAVYRMHSVLVTGDATDVHTSGPPDGLPLSLTPPRTRKGSSGASSLYTHSTDTQVMANQGGYYQLQANPGLWYLSIKPGPVAAAYCIASMNGVVVPGCAAPHTAAGAAVASANFTGGQHIPVVVDSFSGHYLSLQVRHTPLQPQVGLHSILRQMASDVQHRWPPPWLSRGVKPQQPVKPTLNIFSVASGHLYERFLRMMFYSVHKTSSDQYGVNTTRIKFWVIENFLSPQFKRYIPLLAEKLGFEVGFVTYRWPWWLPRQTEKQRKIWAYKILFLDVLFPLDVDRVIFVDADQTAQADLHELYNMDIGHSPVAMTPFCQDYRNEATVKFRFWEHGFWVSHLRGKPYHISAIFLVDLRQFRAMLAGDRYRSTYAGLAADPNSLSNLDQDLPNYLQSTIPIFSLPEKWLWCETWCSARSKSRAKTIDLCNNPLTKMPKLDNAKMIIPGWEELDNTLQNLSDSLLANQ